MIHHRIKIKRMYFQRILDGKKNFEVRLNDRDYQVGDELKFIILDEQGQQEYSDIPFRITYIHAGLGMADKYVVLAIEEIKQ